MTLLLKAIFKTLPRYSRAFLKKIRERGFLPTLREYCRLIRNLLTIEKAERLRPKAPVPSFDCGNSPRIAVQIHCFYPEALPSLLSYVNRIPYRFDCFVSTDTAEKKERCEQILAAQSKATANYIQCFPNRGKDVGPMLQQLPEETLKQYDYLLHLHTKNTGHTAFADGWMQHLLTTLLDSSGHIAAILDRMERGSCGMVFQTTYPMVKPALGWNGNRENCTSYLKALGIPADMRKAPVFPAGNMFWAKTDAVMPAFAHGFTAADFPRETGQEDGTLAHCVERCWGIVVRAQGYLCLRVKPSSRRVPGK